MVCNRCIMMVRQQFEKLGLKPVRVDLGFVELDQPPTEAQMVQPDRSLRKQEFEIPDDARSKTIERIKTLLIRLIQYDEKVRG
jgi:AraC family transcriptional regulator